jgi:hypothetical protein
VNGTWGKSRTSAEGSSDTGAAAVFETGAARAVVLGFETNAEASAAPATATDGSGSKVGGKTWDKSSALVGAVRDAVDKLYAGEIVAFG